MPFLSLDALNPDIEIHHELRHDLESLFYVVIWICFTRKGPNNDVRNLDYRKSLLQDWNTDTLKKIYFAKVASVCTLLWFSKRVLEGIDSYFQPIAPVLIRLRSLLMPDTQESIEDIEDDTKNIAGRLRELQDKTSITWKVTSPEDYDKRFPYDFFATLFIDILEHGIRDVASRNVLPLAPPIIPAIARLGPQTRSMTKLNPEIQPNRAMDAGNAEWQAKVGLGDEKDKMELEVANPEIEEQADEDEDAMAEQEGDNNETDDEAEEAEVAAALRLFEVAAAVAEKEAIAAAAKKEAIAAAAELEAAAAPGPTLVDDDALALHVVGDAETEDDVDGEDDNKDEDEVTAMVLGKLSNNAERDPSIVQAEFEDDSDSESEDEAQAENPPQDASDDDEDLEEELFVRLYRIGRKTRVTQMVKG